MQTVKQVLAKMPGHYRVSQVDVGGRHQPHIDRDRRARTQAHHFTLLQNPQQFHLHVQRQIADLIEEQRAAIGRFKPAGLVGGSTGERAFFMAEQFAFHQGFGKRTAIHRHKGLTPATAQIVDMPCDQFLAGAGLANDQGVGFTGGQALDTRQQFLGARVLEDQHGGTHRLGQFAGIGMGDQRHGAFLAVKARAQ